MQVPCRKELDVLNMQPEIGSDVPRKSSTQREHGSRVNGKTSRPLSNHEQDRPAQRPLRFPSVLIALPLKVLRMSSVGRLGWQRGRAQCIKGNLESLENERYCYLYKYTSVYVDEGPTV